MCRHVSNFQLTFPSHWTSVSDQGTRICNSSISPLTHSPWDISVKRTRILRLGPVGVSETTFLLRCEAFTAAIVFVVSKIDSNAIRSLFPTNRRPWFPYLSSRGNAVKKERQRKRLYDVRMEEQRKLQVKNQGYDKRIVDARNSIHRVKLLGVSTRRLRWPFPWIVKGQDLLQLKTLYHENHEPLLKLIFQLLFNDCATSALV